jgi:hypothetical protein
MSADASGRPVISYLFIGVFDFICFLIAGEAWHAGESRSAVRWFIAGVVCLVVGVFWQKIGRIFRKRTDLEIAWKPGVFPYHYEYPSPNSGDLNLQYRIAVVNNTGRSLANVRVTLSRLSPLVLNCVPCNLRQMHDNKEPYDRSFSLTPRGHQFIDLLLQHPNGSEFWLFHTVTEVRDWRIPAQAYSMTITAESDDSDPISRDFELVRNGQLWGLIDKGTSKKPKKSEGQREVSSGPVDPPRPETVRAATGKQDKPKLQVTRIIAQTWHTGIVYDKSPKPDKDSRDNIAYYLEIVSTSEASTIRDVQVQLTGIDPPVQNLDWLPVLLFHKHDHAPHAERFDLHPGAVKHIDLVSASRGDDHFEVRHIVDGVNRNVPINGHHCLTVTITASDTPKLSASFDVFMDSTGVLQCNMM